MHPQPPPMIPDMQAMQDAEHIRLLVIFHYIWAGIIALGGFIPIIYVVIGIGMFGAAGSAGSGASPDELRFIGVTFAVMGGVATLICWAMAALTFFAGKFLAERRGATFILVIACINCLNMPVGTALGVFTIIVTQRPSVKRLFEQPETALGSFC